MKLPNLYFYPKLIEDEGMEKRTKNVKRLCSYISSLEFNEIFHITRFLNSKDRDIIYLLVFADKKRIEISAILGRIPSLLTYDIQRILQRIDFIKWLDEKYPIFTDFLERYQDSISSVVTETLTLMFFTTSFTQSSNIIGVHQLQFTLRFRRSMELLKKMNEKEVYSIFKHIDFNRNIIKRTYKSYNHNFKKKV